MKSKLKSLALAGVLASLALAACSGESNKEYIVPQYEDDKAISIGVWNGSYTTLNEKNVADLADAGINLFIANQYTINQSFLDSCLAHGVSVIPEARSWNGGTPVFYAHEAVVGYDIYDEPPASVFDTLAQKHALWEQSFSDKLFYVNLFPSYANPTALGGSLENYVAEFMNKVQPKVLSYDYYPLQKNPDNDEVCRLRDTYFSDIDIFSHYAKEAGVPLWYSVQTAGHQSYVSPTVEELRWQMAVAMTYGSRALLHYVYSSHESGYDPMVTMQGEKTDVFERVKEADLEITAWDHIYMNFDWLGVTPVTSDSGDENWMFNLLRYDTPIEDVAGVSDVSSDTDVLLGSFEDEDGNKGFMLTNASNPSEKKNAETKITFSSEYKGVMVIEKGETSIIDLNKGVATIQLEAGEGKFLIPLKTK